ncbi:membrane-associated phospholipid phosphatase [Catenulispora sp. MAP12-49]|uniref:phosphatase PAP2 family protein n=1 Tax=unclassified Catenulispora TaxID=414885 RepID=UPI0035147460
MTDAQIAASASGTGEPGTVREEVPAAGPGTGKPAPDRRRALRQPEIRIPLILLGVFLVLWVLVLARPTFLTSFDLWARNHVQDVAHATDGKHRWPLFKGIADLGGGVSVHGVPFQIQVPVVALALVGLNAAAVRRSWRPVLAMTAGYAALLVVLFLKAIGNRPGPSMAGQAMSGGLGYFPSGHTGNTMLGYGTAALILAFVFTGHRARIAIAIAMTLWALAVGFSLVWMDYHWVSDVLGSYALCGAALFGVARVLGFRISRS